MARNPRRLALVVAAVLGLTAASQAQQSPVSAERVKAEFLHAWNAYKQYAWGHDALKP